MIMRASSLLLILFAASTLQAQSKPTRALVVTEAALELLQKRAAS